MLVGLTFCWSFFISNNNENINNNTDSETSIKRTPLGPSQVEPYRLVNGLHLIPSAKLTLTH